MWSLHIVLSGEFPTDSCTASQPKTMYCSSSQPVMIHRDSCIGRGAFGAVYRATQGSLTIAAKVLDSRLVSLKGQGRVARAEAHRVPSERFLQECQLLSQLTHPNIVQYLGLSQDQDSDLPVLLMELMDESLTSLLERFRPLLPLQTQINISYDIALALSFLHSKNILHRDLSSNNVLMIGDRRAKVADFGMAAFMDANNLTVCPGNSVYMPPEAKINPPVLSDKTDCFSFGVLAVQIMTGKFPDPDTAQPLALWKSWMQHEAEIEKRRNHIQLIPTDHPLLQLACDCLKTKHAARPDANTLCKRMEQHISKTPTDPPHKRARTITSSTFNTNRSQASINTPEQGLTSAIQEHLWQVSPDEEGEEFDVVQLREVDMSAVPFRHVSDISHSRRMRWSTRNPGHRAPRPLCRTTDAVLLDQTIYLLLGVEPLPMSLYSYEPLRLKWHDHPDCPVDRAALGVVRDHVVLVGGVEEGGKPLKTLYNLSGEHWETHYPPMSTRRSNPIITFCNNFLIVAGGLGKKRSPLKTVEALDTETLKWSSVDSLPKPCVGLTSAQLCGKKVYILGESEMYCCDAEELISSGWMSGASVWRETAKVPVRHSTLAYQRNKLFALGGKFPNGNATSAVYEFEESEESWRIVGRFETARSQCFAVGGRTMMVIIGGVGDNGQCVNNIEVSRSRE